MGKSAKVAVLAGMVCLLAAARQIRSMVGSDFEAVVSVDAGGNPILPVSGGGTGPPPPPPPAAGGGSGGGGGGGGCGLSGLEALVLLAFVRSVRRR